MRGCEGAMAGGVTDRRGESCGERVERQKGNERDLGEGEERNWRWARGLGAASRRERALTVILIAEEGRASTQRATAPTSLIDAVLDPRWMRPDIIITLMESRALLVTLAIGSSGWPVV